MRLHVPAAPLAAILLSTLLTAPALAAHKPKSTDAAPAAAPTGAVAKDPVIATVGPESIHMSDMEAAAATLPPEARQMPQNELYSRLLDQMIARKTLVLEARKMGLQKDPAVQRLMENAGEAVLQNALLQKMIGPKVGEDAIKAAFDKQVAGKPGETEVHARHILVDTQAKAQDIIKQLQAGAKFEDLAKKYSDPKDPSSQQGGDLGFFKKGDMLPEFSEAAFALKPGTYTTTPVHTKYGWHVIQSVETKVVPPPTYDQVHDQLKQQVVLQNYREEVKKAQAGLKITVFNPDGSPIKPQAPGAAPTAAAPAAAPAPAAPPK